MRFPWIGILVALNVLAWTVAFAVPNKQFSWEANTESDLSGYRIYVCASEPCNKQTGQLLGETTNLTFQVPEGAGFAFITAIDTSGNESPESNVVTYFLDQTAPVAPSGFRVEEVP